MKISLLFANLVLTFQNSMSACLCVPKPHSLEWTRTALFIYFADKKVVYTKFANELENMS